MDHKFSKNIECQLGIRGMQGVQQGGRIGILKKL